MENNKPAGITIRGMAPLLLVFDMPTSLRFYRDILGFVVKGKSNEGEGDNVYWALMEHSGVELMLNGLYEPHERPAAPDAQRMEAHYDTSIYFGCPDVNAAYDYLAAKGVDVTTPVITKYNFNALYVKDPDGYLLVFHWPIQQ